MKVAIFGVFAALYLNITDIYCQVVPPPLEGGHYHGGVTEQNKGGTAEDTGIGVLATK